MPSLTSTRRKVLGVLFALSFSSVTPAFADGHIMLTVESPSMDAQEFDLGALDSLTQATVNTSNEFVSGTVAFSGPLAREVVSNAGGSETSTIVLTAINEYQIEVPASDFYSYDVVLATRMNGDLLSRRDKGPIWLMYPISDHTELQDSAVNSKLIWQLVHLKVQ